MTTHKTLKHRVRARMEKTGERYTAARRNVTAAAAPAAARRAPATAPAKPAPGAPPPVSDEAVRKATGRGWDEWLDDPQDDAGAVAWRAPRHRPLGRRRAPVSPAGGPRASRSASSGRAACAPRTSGRRASRSARRRRCSVPVERLYEAFADAKQRNGWLGHAARCPLVDGTADRSTSTGVNGSRVAARFTAQGPAKIPGRAPAGAAARRRRGRGAAGLLADRELADLKARLESRIRGSGSSRLGRRRPPFWVPASQRFFQTSCASPRQYSAVCRNSRADAPTRIRVGQAAEMLGVTVETAPALGGRGPPAAGALERRPAARAARRGHPAPGRAAARPASSGRSSPGRRATASRASSPGSSGTASPRSSRSSPGPHRIVSLMTAEAVDEIGPAGRRRGDRRRQGDERDRRGPVVEGIAR